MEIHYTIYEVIVPPNFQKKIIRSRLRFRNKELLSKRFAFHPEYTRQKTLYRAINAQRRTRWYSRPLNDYESREMLAMSRFVSERRCSPRKACLSPFKRHPTLQTFPGWLARRLESHKAPLGDAVAKLPAFCSTCGCIHVFWVSELA